MRIFIFLGFILMILACGEDDCYDPQMEADHPGVCTQDCPGVCGCDNMTYCNTCIANSQGIAVVSQSPCN